MRALQAYLILGVPVTRGACDMKVAEIRGWSWSTTPFSLSSKFSLYYYRLVSLLFIGFTYTLLDRQCASREIDVPWIKKRKANFAEHELFTFCFSFELYTPSFAFRSLHSSLVGEKLLSSLSSAVPFVLRRKLFLEILGGIIAAPRSKSGEVDPPLSLLNVRVAGIV